MTFMTQVFRGAAKGSRMAKYRTFEGHPERAVRSRSFGGRARLVWRGCAGRFLLLLLLMLPAVVRAQFTCETNNGAITITGYAGPGGAVTIPSVINNLPVISIGWRAFAGCTSLTSITIPSSATTIGSSAFSGCSSLVSITIPSGVTSIGNKAFSGCTGLTSITIPNGVTSIGGWAFSGCTSLTSITIPNTVTSIGDPPFADCTRLLAINVGPLNSSYSSVSGVLFNKNQSTLIECPGGMVGSYTIPNSVTSIGDYAFYGCSSLTSITIPNSVTTIAEFAFSGCGRLTSILIPNGITSIERFSFLQCSKLTSISIPNSVTSIGGAAFANCASLTSITIPGGVTSIDISGEDEDLWFYMVYGVFPTFVRCPNLMAINVDPLNSAYSSVNGVLLNKNTSTLIRCPEGKAGSFTIPSSVTSTEESAFYGCSSLTSITVPNSVTNIGGVGSIAGGGRSAAAAAWWQSMWGRLIPRIAA
jgi:hypothetical protein